ncbi:hypothetical protein ACFLTH_04435 [Bacteroidota bacterium]
MVNLSAEEKSRLRKLSQDESSNEIFLLRKEPDDDFEYLVNKDFENVSNNVRLATREEVTNLHLIHTLLGHSHEGHGEFHTFFDLSGHRKKKELPKSKIPIRYENVFLEDIIGALGLDVSEIKRRRDHQINLIKDWINKRLETMKSNGGGNITADDLRLYIYDSSEGKYIPLAGAHMFRHTTIENIGNVLRGFYLGTRLDNHEWREKVEEKYNIEMHKGTTESVNLNELKRNGLTIGDLSNGNYLKILKIENTDNPLEELHRLKIISKNEREKSNGDFRIGYVELSRGHGVSDDAAFLAVSLMYGTEAGLGFLLADAIDTFDKCTKWIYSGGQDEKMGNLLRTNLKQVGQDVPEDNEVLEFIYLSTIDTENKRTFPSCSQRRFWQLNDQEYYAVQSHIAFLKYIKNDAHYPPHTKIGFDNVNNGDFYASFLRKMINNIDKGIIDDKFGISQRQDLVKKFLKTD